MAQILPQAHAKLVIKLEGHNVGKDPVLLYGKISAHADNSCNEIVLFNRCSDNPAKVCEGTPIPLCMDAVDLYACLNVEAHLKGVNPCGCPTKIADGDANFCAKHCGTSTARIGEITVTVYWSSKNN